MIVMTDITNKISNKTVLVIAAHPDDEMLGVGGTVAKHVAAGDTVFSLILGEGVASRDMSDEEKQRQLVELHDHAKKANAVLGVKEVFFELLPDNAFDKLPLLDVIKVVEKYVVKIKPNIIYTHWAHDLNIDHRMTFQSVITACRPYAHAVEAIYSFEIPSVTECQRDGNVFHPMVYHDVTAFLQKKLDALANYTGEMRPFPHPRSPEGIRALATVRGMESNLHAAEAFELVREVKL